MSFLTKRKIQGGRYYIRWHQNGKIKWKSTKQKSHEKAQEVYSAWLKQNNYCIGDFTIQDLFDKKLRHVKNHCSTKTILIYKSVFKNYLTFHENKILSKVIPDDLEEYKSHRLKKVSKVSINIEVRTLKAIFEYAASDNIGMLLKNPFKNIKQFPVPEKKRVYISDHELKLILANCNNSLISEVIIHAINTGMRREEILNLRYKDINLEARTLDVLHTKTNCIRIIPLSGQLYDQLYKYYYDESGCIRLYNPEDRIYRISGDYVTHTFKKIIRKLSLPDHYKFHSLRHTAITNLLRHSGNVYISMEIAGHKSIKTTQIYLHNIPEEVRAAVNYLSIK